MLKSKQNKKPSSAEGKCLAVKKDDRVRIRLSAGKEGKEMTLYSHSRQKLSVTAGEILVGTRAKSKE